MRTAQSDPVVTGEESMDIPFICWEPFLAGHFRSRHPLKDVYLYPYFVIIIALTQKAVLLILQPLKSNV